MKKKTHYVDKEHFYNVIKEYKERKAVNPNEKIPEEAGRIILAIAQGLAKKSWFNGYSWIDEMISDRVLRAIEVFDRFSLEDQKKNPFGYFGLVIMRSFMQRILKEKKFHRGNLALISTTNLYDVMPGEEYILTNDQLIGDFKFDSLGRERNTHD